MKNIMTAEEIREWQADPTHIREWYNVIFKDMVLPPEFYGHFHQCEFINCVFDGNDPKGMGTSHMLRCTFKGCAYQNAQFADALFVDCYMSSEKLDTANFDRTEFHRCEISCASFRCASLRGSYFKECALTSSDFRYAFMRGAYPNGEATHLYRCILDGMHCLTEDLPRIGIYAYSK